MTYTTYDSPVGTFVVAARDGALFRVRIITAEGRFAPESTWSRDDVGLADLREQIGAYFAGELRRFDFSIPEGATAFHRDVWRIVSSIPYGETSTYGQIAREAGSPQGARAVGMAMNRNALGLVIPCHRVLASDGRLNGYLYGLDVKRSLLEFERCVVTGGDPQAFWAAEPPLMPQMAALSAE